MNLLFIQGGSRLKQAADGRWFTDPNFTDEVWRRYMALCDFLTIIIRKEKKVYTVEEAEKRFNAIPVDKKVRVVPVDDITRPIINLANPLVRASIANTIKAEVKKADKVIIRSASFYTDICQKACKEYKKPYLFEVTGFALEGMSHHSLLGKLSANHFEQLTKRIAREAECAIYVTDEALQKRYPCKKMLGCSDVVLEPADEKILDARLKKISERKQDDIIRIGTAAFLDVMWKGQHNVIRAIAELKRRGITNIQYEMIGTGKGLHLSKLAEELGVSDQVKILGARPHAEVFNWLDEIDIYVQPSYQEGLCRAIAEALSRACPIICSDTGGNYELVSREYIFPCGDYKTLASLIESIQPKLTEQAKQNFDRSKHYGKERLESLRNIFFFEFVR